MAFEQNPLIARKTAEIIQKLENGETVEKSYIVEENIFTKDNVAEFLEGRTY